MLAGADMVRLYGHLGPNEALKVLPGGATLWDVNPVPCSGTWLSASRARVIFAASISLPVSEFRRS